MVKATIFEAKTRLSALVKKAQQGAETVIITSGREEKPVARIEAIPPAKPKKRLGVMETPGFTIPDSFWEPLPPGWDGETEPK